MRIKVHPWTIFGKVHVTLRGNDLVTQNVFGGDAVLGGSDVTVTLSPDPVGGDDQFELSGIGLLVGDPTLTCSDLQTEEQIAHGECPMGAHLHIKGFEPATGDAQGHFSLLVHLDVWVEPSTVNFQFRNGDTARVIDFWNAEVVSGGGEGDAHAAFRLKKNVLAWIGERKSSFGFRFEGSLTAMPTITCSNFGKPFPFPPPPTPPGPPPLAPPHFDVDSSLCFLGGVASWLHPPNTDPQIGWALPWQVSVSMPRWEPGVTLVLAFEGEKLHEHPVRLSAIEPDDGGTRLETTTSHSLGITLFPSPLHGFTITGTGAVTGIKSMSCCCRAPPPPPPPPPTFQLSARDEWLSSHAASPPPPPPPPPREPRVHRTIDGLTIASPSPPPYPPPPPMGDVSTWTRVFAMIVGFAVLMGSALRWLEHRSANQLKRMHKEKAAKKIARTHAVIAPARTAADEPETALVVKVPEGARGARREGKQGGEAIPVGKQGEDAKDILLQLQEAGSSSSESEGGSGAPAQGHSGGGCGRRRASAGSSAGSGSDDSSDSRSSSSSSGDCGSSGPLATGAEGGVGVRGGGSRTGGGRSESGGGVRDDSDGGSGADRGGGCRADGGGGTPHAKLFVQVGEGGASTLRFDAKLVDSPAELVELVADSLGREEDQVRLELVDEAGRARAITGATRLSHLHEASVIRLADKPAKSAKHGGGRRLLPGMGRPRARGGHVALRGQSDDDLEEAVRPPRRRCSSFDEADSLLSSAAAPGKAPRGGRRGARTPGRAPAGVPGAASMDALD